MKTYKVKITIIAEVSSSKYDEDTESIIDELSRDCDYEIPSTENVNVINTEQRYCQLL